MLYELSPGETPRLVLAASGGGSTARHIIDQCQSPVGDLHGKVTPVLMVVDRECGAIQHAEAANIPWVLCSGKGKNPNYWANELLAHCERVQANIWGQYGWTPVTPERFIRLFDGICVNQHPVTLDPGRLDFGGQGMHGRRAFAAAFIYAKLTGQLWSEATAHFAEPLVDKGAIICVEKVEIFPKDDLLAFCARALPVEHRVQTKALKMLVEGTVVPFVREMPFIIPGTEDLWQQAKDTAALLFPNG